MDKPDWSVTAADICALLANAVQSHPERVYCRAGEMTLSYADMAGAVGALAAQLGPEARGRTVALVLPNSAAFLVGYFGALAAGAQPALVNYAHPDATVVKLLAGLDVAAVLSDREIPGLDVTAFSDALLPRGAALPEARVAQHGAAAILFSGGTTGLPKQVDHAHRALIDKVARMEWGWPTQDAETWLPVAPFTHIYGFLMGVLNPVLRAGTVVIPPRFHPDLIVEMLQSERVTIFGGGPPAIYQAIMASQHFEGASFPDLRVCPGGGAPFPLAVHERWTAATGLPITEGYGMTEIAPICVNTAHAGMQPGAAGKPVPDTEVEIVDLQNGAVLGAGETGEIRVRGPHLMRGYAGDPDETKLALRDGWLYTGDIGRIDTEGFVIISDRKKDVIFVKGFNVFPREVEETLLAHDAVSGACVVGRSDERAGELPVAFVTLRDTASEEHLLAHCADTLAGYKLPAEIVIRDALPMTPAAKVDRSALRAEANA
jgi:long-chain acyl-CoA synthetase